MIDRCFNPACKRKLHYLRDGRVVRVIQGKNDDYSTDDYSIEHYWLCGPCYDVYDFVFLPSGKVTIEPRSRGHSPEVHFGDVLLPAGGYKGYCGI